ncbi:MAG: hypothetical protein J6T16_00405 [Opitutales bacterium]|nr:hypothetical protein [Opitutales bacterium]
MNISGALVKNICARKICGGNFNMTRQSPCKRAKKPPKTFGLRRKLQRGMGGNRTHFCKKYYIDYKQLAILFFLCVFFVSFLFFLICCFFIVKKFFRGQTHEKSKQASEAGTPRPPWRTRTRARQVIDYHLQKTRKYLIKSNLLF